MKSQRDIFSKETFAFLEKQVQLKDLRVLEVGCGMGDLALMCKNAGAKVVAIDSRKDAVLETGKKGLNAIHVDFLEFEDTKFDLILFTRSLHHIQNLRSASRKAASLIKSTGKILLEEFDVENIDEKTARWYYDTRSLLSAKGLTRDRYQEVTDPLLEWEKEHEHDPPLNSGLEMSEALSSDFELGRPLRGPYLYRSICGDLIENKSSMELTTEILRSERQLIDEEKLLPVGYRQLARPRNYE